MEVPNEVQRFLVISFFLQKYKNLLN